MARTVDQVAAWMNKAYPTRNFDQQCQRLVWNVIYNVMGYTRDSQMVTYPTARAARLASKIESTDASKAPAGAIHYWLNPAAEGHVGVSLGGESVLMTGTSAALGVGGQKLGNNYGITTVSAYTKARNNPYAGWSMRNGSNASIVGKIAGRTASSAPAKTTSPVSKPATTTGTTTTPVIDLGKDSDMNYIIRSKNRPHAAIIGGEFKRLANSEELSIVQKLTPIAILDKLNDREYDVLRAIAARGEGVTKSEVQAIVDKLAKNGVTITAELDLDAIADAVNDEAAARLKG